MLDFLSFLLWNLALLAAVRVSCWLIRCARPDLSLHGTRVFLGLMAIALVFDTAVTFLVFADAGGPWRVHNPSETYSERAYSYVLAALVALLVARHMKQRRVSREQRESRESSRSRNGKAPEGALEIKTSPYSKSTLPM